ncbi:n-acetylglucosamine-1-phosphodiester alpha-n-acetylglucosaminidase [Anaeramoeba ignava]|uniref:N-acetylglucosamine-1-phosphodiester alpha-n-acetylglucosaminidase n=1 Tax=Anaeramoeba ignava TaxID=1746090 RepID=A0A9Q0LGX3_ANAIG|nr:n-acetylglucosamine-1-phosphodiester alpha-n-acetylglucosaminidase [Anaeramoeba ignava]
MKFFLFTLLILFTFQQQTDYITFPISKTTNPTPIIKHTIINQENKENEKNTTGNLFIIQNPINHFHFLPPNGGCPGMVRTTETAKTNNCTLATNAGFFDMVTGECLGNFISNGEIIQHLSFKRSNFGLTKDGNYLFGYLQDQDVLDLGFNDLVSGSVWLVRNGKSYVEESVKIEQPSSNFVTEKAPRVAIGHDKSGFLMILAVNGLESDDYGLDLYQFADLSISLGFVNALNLDGGGSETAWFQNKIWNTCSDLCTSKDIQFHCPNTQIRCQRAVTTITCVK